MKLYSLKIEGFRRHSNTEILFSEATFLIGENNVGKSSTLAALEYLLSDKKSIDAKEFLSNNDGPLTNEIILTGEFRNIPKEAEQWRGFKGRLLKYEVPEGSEETGIKIVYRKTYTLNAKQCKIEMMEYKRELSEIFCECKTIEDYINAGINESLLVEVIGNKPIDKNLTAAEQKKIRELEEVYNFDETEIDWFENPGGISQNVLSKLPKFLLIPAEDKTGELSESKGALTSTLKDLFKDVREESEHYKKAQEYLNKLAKELDPKDESSEFGVMMSDLNTALDRVFPSTSILVKATLEDADESINPQFEISMQSNITTDVKFQGTGMIRAAVFALLRYKTQRDLKKLEKEGYVQPLIIGFEEPEIYLHPKAAQQMRENIYELANSNNNQIVCTTHSPYMIDISKKPAQVLNSLSVKEHTVYKGTCIDSIKSTPFTATQAFKELQEEDKTYIKMLLKIDDYIAKVFFAKKTIIVEGDTEELVLRESIKRMPDKIKKVVNSDYEIIKARGKAVIISLVKYLKSMGIDLIVIHDRDKGTEKAESFNPHILQAIGDETRRIMMEECIEDVLGYAPPSSDKPYKAYKFISDNWGEDWDSVGSKWKDIIENQILKKEFEQIKFKVEELVAAD